VLLLLEVGLRSFALVVFVVCLWFVAGCFVGLQRQAENEAAIKEKIETEKSLKKLQRLY
jgi:hypothetical protein